MARESMDKKQSNRIVELVESAIRREVNGETPKGFYGRVCPPSVPLSIDLT